MLVPDCPLVKPRLLERYVDPMLKELEEVSVILIVVELVENEKVVAASAAAISVARAVRSVEAV
jgi:hypothetical protein